MLNRQIFVVLPIAMDFYTFMKMWIAALALLIIVFTSASVPPGVSTILPRYLNASTSVSASPSRMIGISQVAYRVSGSLCSVLSYCLALANGCETVVRGHTHTPDRGGAVARR